MPGFDGSFYLRQFADTSRECQVASDPLLHYVILGWREGRAPSARFDPWYFGRVNPGLPRNVDPLLLHGMSKGAATPCHELSVPRQNRRGRPDQDGILTIHHARGGGSGTYLELFEENERELGFNVVRLRALPGAPTLGAVDEIGDRNSPKRSQTFDLAHDLRELADYCRSRHIVRVVVNHLIDRPPEALSWIKRLSYMLGCGYEVILHDYFALCPRVTLVTGASEFCNVAPAATCAACTSSHGSEVKGLDPYNWRRDFLSFLEGASKLVVPSADMRARLQPYLPSRPISVWRPEEDEQIPPEREPYLGTDEPLRVLSIGALSIPKGANVLATLAREARSAREPLTFKLIGAGADAALLHGAGVQTTGFYRPSDLDRLIDAANPHVVFLPSVWPETWSFVLTHALRHGLPIVAFDIGAPAERLRELGRGHLLPLELAADPPALLRVFRRLRCQYATRQNT
ncbi:MAG: glycosyltransferase [Enhydrobacter sp.]|nr:glycosyltransferase [Enhydrobacter sp.]